MKQLFDSLSLDQFPVALAEFENSTLPLDPELKMMLFRSWAEDAPDAALRNSRMVTNSAQGASAFGAAIRAWGRRDIVAALTWAEKNLTGQERTTNLNYLTALAERGADSQTAQLSPKEQLQRAAQEADPEKARRLKLSALSKLAATDPATAAAEAMKSTDEAGRYSELMVVARAWAKTDRTATAAFLEKVKDPSMKNSLHTTVFSDLKRTEPKAALDFAMLQPSGPLRISETGEAIAAIYQRDPDAAIAVYDGLPDEDKRGNFGGFLKVWKDHTPAQAAEALLAIHPLPDNSSLGNHANRANIFLNHLRPWIQTEAKAVGEMAVHLPDKERAEVMYAVAQEWCKTDARAAGAWATALPSGAARDEALKQFTYSWAQHDASTVTAWLNALPADSGKDAAATGFTFSIFDTDPDAALSWSRAIRNEPERMKTLGNAWRKWNSKNPTAAQSWREGASDLSEAERTALDGKGSN